MALIPPNVTLLPPYKNVTFPGLSEEGPKARKCYSVSYKI